MPIASAAPVIALALLQFIGESCVIRISSLAPRPIMCVCCCLPCNTANPEQRYQVHQTHTNYRQPMCATLPLAVGVIPAPPLNCLLCLFALLSVIAMSRTNPPTNCKYGLTSDWGEADFLIRLFFFFLPIVVLKGSGFTVSTFFLYEGFKGLGETCHSGEMAVF